MTLDSIAPVSFAEWVRAVRPGLPLVFLTESGSQSGELMAQLQDEGLRDRLIRVVVWDFARAVGETLLELLSPPTDEVARVSSKRIARRSC